MLKFPILKRTWKQRFPERKKPRAVQNFEKINMFYVKWCFQEMPSLKFLHWALRRKNSKQDHLTPEKLAMFPCRILRKTLIWKTLYSKFFRMWIIAKFHHLFVLINWNLFQYVDILNIFLIYSKKFSLTNALKIFIFRWVKRKSLNNLQCWRVHLTNS